MNYSFLKSKSFLLPTGLGVIFVILMLVSLQSGETKYSSLTRTLIQWDARLYLSIARDGYEKFPCEWDSHYICGNTGWFPFYPMLGGTIGLLGLDHRLALIGLSWLTFWLALLVLYRLFYDLWGHRAAVVAILAMLVFPGSFYYLTAFPYSLYLLLASVIFYLLHKQRYSLIWLPSAALAVTYPSGVLIGLPLLCVLIQRWKSLGGREKRALIGALVAVGAALILYCAYYWWKFGDFFLYFHVQSQSYYAHTAAFPLWTMLQSLQQLPLESPVSLTLVLAVVAVITFWTRRIPAAWQVFMVAVLLFTPTMGTTDCYYRHIVVAFPLFALVGLAAEHRWRRFLVPLYFILCVIINWLVLLPDYKAGALM